MDDELIERLSTPWIVIDEDDKGAKSGDPIAAPPFEWNVTDIDSPDDINETTTLARASEETGGRPAGVEDAVICNRHVDVVFGASMDDFHRASMLAAEGGGSMSIDMEDGVFSLRVGDEVSSQSEDEDDEESI